MPTPTHKLAIAIRGKVPTFDENGAPVIRILRKTRPGTGNLEGYPLRDHVACKPFIPTDRKTWKQTHWRNSFAEGVAQWQALSENEQETWEREAEPLGLCGVNLWLRRYLKTTGQPPTVRYSLRDYLLASHSIIPARTTTGGAFRLWPPPQTQQFRTSALITTGDPATTLTMAGSTYTTLITLRLTNLSDHPCQLTLWLNEGNGDFCAWLTRNETLTALRTMKRQNILLTASRYLKIWLNPDHNPDNPTLAIQVTGHYWRD